MFTLTKASEDTKLTIKWGTVGLVILFILFIVVRVIISVSHTLFPPPPPTANTAYGKLPQISFPQSTINNNFTYTLNTLSGTLPQLGDLGKVHRMVYTPPDLLGLQKAGKLASTLGFENGPYQYTNQLYDWSAQDEAQRHLRMSILNYDFWITSNMSADPNVVSSNHLPDQADAISFVKQQLQNIDMYYPDIDDSKSKTSLYALKNNVLSPVLALTDAQVVRVDLFQKDVDNLPIYYEHPNQSVMNFLVSGGAYLPQLVGASFVYQTPQSDYATYPLKTANEAFNELKVGRAYIASYYGSSQNIIINNIFLAYYIGSTPQTYLMPIIVFQGNDGFYAYVPAVTDEWISK